MVLLMPTSPDPEGERPVPGENATLKRAARGSAINLAGSFVSAFATFGLTVLVTRMVSGQDAGVFFSATSLFLLAVAFSQLGTSTGLVYFLSRARAQQNLHQAQTYMRVALTPVLCAAVVIGVLIFATAAPLGALLSPGREQEFASYLRVMAFFVPCAALMQLAVAATQGLGSMRPFAAIEHVCRPLLQLLLVGAALTVFDSSGIAWYWTAAYLPTAVVAWVWWQRLRDKAAPQESDPEFRPHAQFWRFSAPRALANVAQVAMQRLDIILVGALAGLEAAAIYTAATRLLVLGQMIARAVAVSGQPLLGESLGREDRTDARHLYRVTTGWLVAVTWPWYISLMIWAPLLLGIFGDEYETGRHALLVLSAAMLFATSCGMVDMVLNMGGKSFWNLANVVIAFSVNIVIDLILIPRIGLLGAAIGWGSAIVLANLLPLIQVRHFLRMTPYGRGMLYAGASAAVSFGVIPAVVGIGTSWAYAPLAWSFVGGLTLYIALLGFFRHHVALPALFSAIRRRRRSSLKG